MILNLTKLSWVELVIKIWVKLSQVESDVESSWTGSPNWGGFDPNNCYAHFRHIVPRQVLNSIWAVWDLRNTGTRLIHFGTNLTFFLIVLLGSLRTISLLLFWSQLNWAVYVWSLLILDTSVFGFLLFNCVVIIWSLLVTDTPVFRFMVFNWSVNIWSCLIQDTLVFKCLV